MMSAKNQKNILAQQAASIHKAAVPGPKHTKNTAGIPFDITGGENVPFYPPVKNVADPPFTIKGTNSGGTPQLPQTGKPNPPFTKGK